MFSTLCNSKFVNKKDQGNMNNYTQHNYRFVLDNLNIHNACKVSFQSISTILYESVSLPIKLNDMNIERINEKLHNCI